MAARARNFAYYAMPALCSMLYNAHYAQNYAGIIGASLVCNTVFIYIAY